MNISPLYLTAGTIGVPVVANALGGNLSPGTFALLSGAAALGLAYAATRPKLRDDVKNVALGGAIGAGVIAALAAQSQVPVLLGPATGRLSLVNAAAALAEARRVQGVSQFAAPPAVPGFMGAQMPLRPAGSPARFQRVRRWRDMPRPILVSS